MDDYLTNGIELEYSNNKCIKEEQQEADEKSVNAAEDQQEENKEAVNVAEDQQEENKEALNAAEDQQEENKEAVNAAEDQQEENKEAVNVAADQQEVNNGSIYGIQHKQQEVEESINAGGDQQKKDEKSINGGQDPRDDKQDIMKTVPTTRKGVDDYLHSDATSNVMPHFYTEQNHPSANKRQRFPPNKVREVGYEQYSTNLGDASTFSMDEHIWVNTYEIIMDVKAIISVTLATMALVLTAAGLGSGYWVKVNGGGLGLFRECFGGSCINIKPGAVSQKVAAAFLFLALFALLKSVIATSKGLYNTNKDDYNEGFIANIMAAIFLLIGLASYAGMKFQNDNYKQPGWGYILPWVAFVFAIVAGVLAKIAKHNIDKLQMDVKAIISVTLAIVAFALTAVGLGSGYWLKVNGHGVGLFLACDGGSCISIKPSDVSQKVAATFLFLALFSLRVAVIATSNGMNTQHKKAYNVGFIANIMAAIFLLIGLASFTGLVLRFGVGFRPGWGYILPWVAFAFAIVAGMLAKLDK